MKRLLILLDDEPHARLKALKEEAGMGWDKFILHLAGLDKKEMGGKVE